MVKKNKRRAVSKAVHGPPEDKGVKPVSNESDPPEEETQPAAEESEGETAAEPEPEPEPKPEPAKAKKCSHCRSALVPHDPNGSKAGCSHCNSCGCCFGPDGLPRPGHPVCALALTE